MINQIESEIDGVGVHIRTDPDGKVWMACDIPPIGIRHEIARDRSVESHRLALFRCHESLLERLNTIALEIREFWDLEPQDKVTISKRDLSDD